MASEYRGLDPATFRKISEAELIPFSNEIEEPVYVPQQPPKRGRNRTLGNGKDKMTMMSMKASMSAYWKEGDSYAEIADAVSDEFGLEGKARLNPKQVSYHIKSLIETTRKHALTNINEKNALVLARYDQIEMLVTEAYFASMSQDTINIERQIKKAKTRDRQKTMAADMKRARGIVSAKNEKNRLNHKTLLEDPLAPYLKTGDLPDLLEITSKQTKKYTRIENKPAGDPRWIAMLIDLNDRRAKLWGLLNRTDLVNGDQELARLPDDERAQKLSAVIHAAMVRKTGDKGALALPSPLGGFAENEVPQEIHELIRKTDLDAQTLDEMALEALDELDNLIPVEVEWN